MHLTAFALVALGVVLTPGPNMIYVISRTISQGRVAGYVSLAGVFFGFVLYMHLVVFGITAVLTAVPYAYDALRISGAIYLTFLAWQTVRPGGKVAFDPRQLPAAGQFKLFVMGFLTNLLNPKSAVLYLSLLPQFIDPAAGDVLTQLLTLGAVQIAISMSVNSALIFGAGGVARFLAERPTWMMLQRWMMATVLGCFAVRLLAESKR